MSKGNEIRITGFGTAGRTAPLVVDAEPAISRGEGLVFIDMQGSADIPDILSDYAKKHGRKFYHWTVDDTAYAGPSDAGPAHYSPLRNWGAKTWVPDNVIDLSDVAANGSVSVFSLNPAHGHAESNLILDLILADMLAVSARLNGHQQHLNFTIVESHPVQEPSYPKSRVHVQKQPRWNGYPDMSSPEVAKLIEKVIFPYALPTTHR
ncbi:MAG: hypothetical protein H9W81_13465 [Enterococcus sp.]|nr:hypothetical protein [Enterococcus sp.]